MARLLSVTVEEIARVEEDSCALCRGLHLTYPACVCMLMEVPLTPQFTASGHQPAAATFTTALLRVCAVHLRVHTHTHTPVHIMLFSACTHSCINSLEKHYLMCLISCWGRANLHVSSCPVLHSDVSAAHHFLVCVAEIPLSMQPSDECQEPGAALWPPAILTFG